MTMSENRFQGSHDPDRSVFLLIEVKEILDPEMYEVYTRQAKPIIISHGGKYVMKSDNLIPLSGEWDTKRMVLLRFQSLGDLRGCFDSAQYRKIAHLRENSVVGKAIIIT
ncbi:MAG: DUF1330 domain-containing protein [Desulfobulbaceae bacterium]|nr:MAG: DUF1330 domain-containing protein [Desulfobulbaceae bacterium]